MKDFGKMANKAGAYVGRTLVSTAVNVVVAAALGAAVDEVQKLGERAMEKHKARKETCDGDKQ